MRERERERERRERERERERGGERERERERAEDLLMELSMAKTHTPSNALYNFFIHPKINANMVYAHELQCNVGMKLYHQVSFVSDEEKPLL